MQNELLHYRNLELRAGSVFDLLLQESFTDSLGGSSVCGVQLGGNHFEYNIFTGLNLLVESGERISCSQVVICTGTFLSGEIHIGIQNVRLSIDFRGSRSAYPNP